ncbi:kinase-like domain-containing protein [Schizophyllum fasciatum]
MHIYSDVAPLTLDDFHYCPVEGFTEDMTLYRPQGYHPVTIGDILNGSSDAQYRILHKLGYGGYATVWLAQRVDASSSYVALKITTAQDQGLAEADLLEAANANERDSSSSHVLALLDKFELPGPNGTHSVLVTDVIVPMLSLRNFHQSPRWRKAAAHGLVQAMLQLHRTGIVHGDFHLGNVGVAMPQPEDQMEFMRDLGEYDMLVVLPVDPANQTPSLPPYILTPCELGGYYAKVAGSTKPQIKVFDFGNAYRTGTEQPAFRGAVEACAPEVAYAQYYEGKERIPIVPSSDLWALGAAIYEIIVGDHFFRNITRRMVPKEAVEMAGCVPPQWQSWWDNDPYPVTLSGDPDEWWSQPWHRKLFTDALASEEDADAAIALLKKLLSLDPQARPTCEEVLQDPWFENVEY